MASLHDTINALASEFAHELLRALRGASLDEIISETSARHVSRRGRRPRAQALGGGGGEVPAPLRSKRSKRLARRSADDLAKMVDKLVGIVSRARNGINAEGLKTALGIDRRELPRPLAMALASEKISKRGHKRATVYFAGTGGTARATPKTARRTKKPTAKKAPKRKTSAKRSAKKAAKSPLKKTKHARASRPNAAVNASAAAPTPVATSA